jgi:2,3-bisphosphoglycerate-dependent phosphoglycerate mutase
VTTSPPTAPTPELRERLRHPLPDGSTELLLVRHGRTAANRARVLQGTTDIPLDAFGLRQAERVADRIAREFVLDAVVSSPLSRASATARAIADRFGLVPTLDPALVEMSFGRYEGLTWEQVRALDPALAARIDDIDDYEAGWPDGDVRSAFYHRIWTAIEGIVEANPGRRVAVVAHGGVIGSFLAILRGQSPNDPAVYALQNCSITHLHVRPAHTEVHRFNDTEHLLDLVEPPDEIEVEG